MIALSDRQSVIDKQRIAFDKYIDLLAIRVAGEAINHEGWKLKFAIASKEVLMWCQNDVVKSLALYAESVNVGNENEILLADAILKFRKSIGYKNWWWKKISTTNIISIYRAGNVNTKQNNIG